MNTNYRRGRLVVTHTPPTTTSKVNINCGCFGCLISIIGLIGILWVLFHISEIVAFITS